MSRKRRRDNYILDGSEVVSSTPKFVPVKPSSDPQRDYIRSLIQSERLQQELDAQGVETFEESQDFDVGDEDEPNSLYEMEEFYDPEPIEEQQQEDATADGTADGTEEKELDNKSQEEQKIKKSLLSKFEEFVSSSDTPADTQKDESEGR